MNKTLINLLQQYTAKELGKRGRGKKTPSGTVINEEIPQEEEQPGLLWQCNKLAKSSNDESSDDEEDHGTTFMICKILWRELMEKCGDRVQCDICNKYICPKCYDKRDILASDHKLRSDIHSTNCPLGRLIM